MPRPRLQSAPSLNVPGSLQSCPVPPVLSSSPHPNPSVSPHPHQPDAQALPVHTLSNNGHTEELSVPSRYSRGHLFAKPCWPCGALCSLWGTRQQRRSRSPRAAAAQGVPSNALHRAGVGRHQRWEGSNAGPWRCKPPCPVCCTEQAFPQRLLTSTLATKQKHYLPCPAPTPFPCPSAEG